MFNLLWQELLSDDLFYYSVFDMFDIWLSELEQVNSLITDGFSRIKGVAHWLKDTTAN